jgi:FecR protein
MYCRHHSATALVAIIAGVIVSTDAQASTRVGGATSVVRDVSGSLSGKTSWTQKVEGDDIYENEFVRTKEESSARISFIDQTGIGVGPAATIKIDHVVFNPNRSASELTLIAEKGPMRWISGISPSSAYRLKTPDAIIRPLGTTFDVLVESQRTTVVLRRGRIEVCPIDAPQRCRILSKPGDTIIATPNDLERPQRAGIGPSEFADRCLSADNMAPCNIMASVQPTTPPGTAPRRVDDRPRRVDDRPRRASESESALAYVPRQVYVRPPIVRQVYVRSPIVRQVHVRPPIVRQVYVRPPIVRQNYMPRPQVRPVPMNVRPAPKYRSG